MNICPNERAFHESSGKCVATCAGGADSDGLCQEAEPSSEDKKNRSGPIAAIVVPVVLALAIAAVVVAIVCKKRKQASVAKNKPVSAKKVALPKLQASRAGSRASVRSAAPSQLLEVKTEGNASDIEKPVITSAPPKSPKLT